MKPCVPRPDTLPDRLQDAPALPPIDLVDGIPADALPTALAHLLAMQARVVARIATSTASHNANGADAKPYTLTHAAGLLDKSSAWLRRRARAGRVPGAQKVGRSWMFDRVSFDRWRCRGEVS